ncbi:MAG: hypothetical protein V3S69_00925 [Dehalococcoidales bacterium]
MATDNTLFNGVGTTNFESTNTGDWLATIFSRKVLDFFKNASVVEGVTNNEYLGEIAAYGDAVEIIKEPVITVASYTRNLATVDTELLDNNLVLQIDQANYFAFKIDDLETKLAHVNWKEMATTSGAYALRDKFDHDVLQFMADGAGTYLNDVAYANGKDVGFGAGETNPLDLLSEMARTLDEANVPEEGRYIVASPKFLEAIVKAGSDLLSTDYNDGATSLKNGLVMAAPLRGFRIHKTNNFPTYTTTGTVKTGNEMLVAGHMSAVATASAITNVETIRLEGSFGDKVRGLHVYARGVVRSESLVVARITAYAGVDVGV